LIDDNDNKETIDFAGNREIYESLKKGQQNIVSLFGAGPLQDHTPTHD